MLRKQRRYVGCAAPVSLIAERRAFQVAQEALKLGAPKAEIFKIDISKVPSIREAFAAVAKVYPKIDISVVNSGVGLMQPFETSTEEQYDQIFNVNSKGAFFAAQESAKILNDGGRIIFISSIVTKGSFAGTSIYAGTKGALNQFARILAVELAPRKITVNTVSPGPTDTEMLPDAYREPMIANSPFKRLGTGEDIARVVSFLASENGSWVTGADLNASGGVAIY